MDASIRIDNFRSIETSIFNIHSGLNVLVGPNGSGKTNILHALKFMSNVVASGASLAMGKAGGPARNFKRGCSDMHFTVATDFPSALYKGRQAIFHLLWNVSLGINEKDNMTYISHESIRILAKPANGDAEAVLSIEVARTAAGGVRTKFFLADADILTKKLLATSYWVTRNSTKAAMFNAVRREVADELRKVRGLPHDSSILEIFSPIGFDVRRLHRDLLALDEYNIQPDVARIASDPLPMATMGNDGAGVSQVIYALETAQFRRFATRSSLSDPYSAADRLADYGFRSMLSKNNPLEEISENLKAAVVSLDAIGTDIDRSTGRRFVVFRSGSYTFRPEEVSDGTIKWLCLLVALYVPRSRVVLLEEPENFMHPWMQQRFIQLAREQTKKNRTSVFFSTHSVTVLNALKVSELLVARKTNGGTQVEAVLDRDEVQKVLNESNFGLGDFWVSGGIGGVAGETQ
ncbi:AAA family ATPase [Lysobacter sp. 5GHs7-4]|uniref:AAA family ATPase n=1 Tax=Lysobacter sp. 5GHs7-4 TaxID=2904253 RepID=UPI001E3DFD35|nr:ATP-binding protein [Lysobacter sp. 5GHs7-4]UHQ24967.1 AAA family ATPase [Lysobacter sp. 5GHs7-4]